MSKTVQFCEISSNLFNSFYRMMGPNPVYLYGFHDVNEWFQENIHCVFPNPLLIQYLVSTFRVQIFVISELPFSSY